MINKENQTPNKKISYIYSVINMAVVDSNRLREMMLTKSAFKKNSHDPIKEKIRQYMEIISNLCHYKEQFASIKFDDKIRLAKLLIGILRFAILKQCNMRDNAKFINAVVNNSTFLILGLKEVSITIDYAFHLIEYFQQQDLNILQNSCDQFIRNLDQIKLDRKQLNRSVLPQITITLGSNQETITKNLFYEICVQISNSQPSEDQLDFLQRSIWSPSYYSHKCLQKVYSKKIMQLQNPFKRLCFLIKLCIQKPSYEVKQVIAFIIRKCYNQSSHMDDICQCTKLCLEMYLFDLQCRKNNEIIDSIIRSSIQLNFLTPIQVIVQNWKYNQNFLFEVCQLYIKITKFNSLQDLSNYLYEINNIQSQQTMDDYKYFVLKILKYYQQNRAKMYNKFKSSLNIFRLFENTQNNNLDLHHQKNKLNALICYSNLLKILKLQQSAENVIVETSFLIVIQVLLIINMGFVDSLKTCQIQPYVSTVIKSSCKNVRMYYYYFFESICRIFRGENQTKNSLKIVRKILNNMIQHSITNIDDSLDCIFSSIDKGEIKTQKEKVIQSIITYVQNNLKTNISSTVGSVIAKLIVSSKIVLKSKKISQQMQPILTLCSNRQNIQSHFINTFEKQMYEILNQIMSNVKSVQNNQNKVNLFLDIFQIYRQRFFLRLQKSALYYTHYYQIVSDFINRLNQLSYYYAKKKIEITYLNIAIQKLKLSLIVNQKYSPYDMFRSMNDNFQQYSLPHYVNVFAKQIHLLAVNQGQATLSTSQQGEFEQFCLKSRNIIKQLTKIAEYLAKSIDITNTYGIVNIMKLPVGNIVFPSSFNVHDLKSMLANLDTIIYYSQAVSNKHLQLFVGIKVSVLLIHYPNKQFYSLKQQTKLRVLCQLLPLVRINKNYKRWVREELKLITIKDKQALKLLETMKLYVLDSSTQNQQQISNQKIALLQASEKIGQSIVFGKQVLRQLMARVIQTLKGAYEQALQNNSLRIVRLPAIQRIPNHLLFETISLFMQQQQSYQSTLFPFEEIFDYDRAFCHTLPNHFVKLIKLMYNKNQISEAKRIFPFAFKLLLKSFNINGIFEALTCIYKNYKVQSIFDSALGIFKQIGINIDKLESIRKKIFDRRRSMVCKYTIHKLSQDFSKVFNDVQLHQVAILQHFAKIILKYFGQTNFVDAFTTSINISKVFKHQISPLLLKVFNHLHNNLSVKKPEVIEIKNFLLTQIMKYINYDFEKAMEYKNVLGILHQSCFDSLLSQEQILEIGFNTIELNYIYKERMLLEQKDKNYFQDLSTSYQFFKQNDEAFRIRSIQKNLNTMLSIIKKQGYPFVMIFPFGNQLAICIITTSIKIKMVDLNQFKDINKITKDIIKDNNQRMDNFNDIPKKVWWQNRINLDSRLQKNISSYSQIENFNFYDEIFNQYPEQEKKQFQILLLIQDSLQNAPYECMNERGPKKGVYRVPSLSYLFKTLRARQKSTVNMANLTYLVDPENNLEPTQTRFKQMKKQYSLWQGIIAKKPNHQEFFQLLKSDVFMFMGHGEGKYIEDHELYDKTTNTIPLIYGCSSVRLVEEDTESHGFALSYLLSGCPLLLGCLWNVTDKDVDKLTSTMISKFRSGKIDLGKTVQQSKTSCNLKYINGAAVILYGLPHRFCYKE